MIDLPKLARSLKIGFSGIAQVVRSEQNMRIHLVAAVTAIGLGFALEIAPSEWVAILFAVGLVLSAECLNTAVEELADRITTERDESIRVAKDAGAAAVLILALVALLVGVIIFGPKLVALVG